LTAGHDSPIPLERKPILVPQFPLREESDI
jgi:hypothetical protein